MRPRSWTLRAAAVLLLAYGLAWGYLGVTFFVAMQRPLLPNSNPGAVATIYVAIVIAFIMCPLLLIEAVLVWRTSPVGVVFALLTSLWVALPLVLVLGAELLSVYTHPNLFDWQFTLGDIALLLLGPGLVIALLLVPSSYRAWVSRPR